MAQKKYLDLTGLQTIIAKLEAREFFTNMGLSEENFTAALKTKYDNLVAGGASQADLTALTTRVASLESLIEADSNAAIDKFNEIVTFLEGINNTDTLQGLMGDISAQVTTAKETADAAKAKAEANETAIAGKADKASTLAGYGILDAQIKADNTIQLGSKTIKPLTQHQSLADYAKTADVNTGLSGKVDKVEGKGLSTKDYTAADQAAVQTIGNKVDKVDGKGLSTNDYTTAEKNAVATIAGKVNEADLVAITTEEITTLLA